MGFNYISLKEFRKHPKDYSFQQVKAMCCKQKLSKKFMRDMADYLNWYAISCEQKLDEDFIEEMSDRVDWRDICGNQKLSEKFIREHLDKIFWDEISFNYKIHLSKDFILEFIDKLQLEMLIYQHCEIQNEEIYRIFLQDEFCTAKVKQAISARPPANINKDFVREFRDKLVIDYKITSQFSRDEEFFKEFKNKIGIIGWEQISFCNNSHSYEFLMRFKEDLNWNGIKPFLERHLTKEQLIEVAKYKEMTMFTHAVGSY